MQDTHITSAFQWITFKLSVRQYISLITSKIMDPSKRLSKLNRWSSTSPPVHLGSTSTAEKTPNFHTYQDTICNVIGFDISILNISKTGVVILLENPFTYSIQSLHILDHNAQVYGHEAIAHFNWSVLSWSLRPQRTPHCIF